jgi:hypothetical protein
MAPSISGPAHAIWPLDTHILVMDRFDFTAPAEIFASKSRGASRRPMSYRRFPTGAEAVRYAMEALPAEVLFGTVMEVDDSRFDAGEIRSLYESADYPFRRSAA